MIRVLLDQGLPRSAVRHLQDHGIDTVVSLLGAQQSSAAYELAGLRYFGMDVDAMIEPEETGPVFELLADALEPEDAVVLVHRDTIDDTLGGLLAGYLIYSGMLDDPIVATDVIQRILARAIGPEGRRLIPEA